MTVKATVTRTKKGALVMTFVTLFSGSIFASDAETSLSELKNLAADFIKEREWGPHHTPKNCSMKIAQEAAELMELFTWIGSQESYEELESNRQAIENELADMLFVAFVFANQCNIDISSAIKHKLQEVKQKYPVEKVKGKHYKYTHYQ